MEFTEVSYLTEVGIPEDFAVTERDIDIRRVVREDICPQIVLFRIIFTELNFVFVAEPCEFRACITQIGSSGTMHTDCHSASFIFVVIRTDSQKCERVSECNESSLTERDNICKIFAEYI